MLLADEMSLEPVPRPRVEVLPPEPRRSRVWPMVGAALVWAARELLPELLTIRQTTWVKSPPPVSYEPAVTRIASRPSRAGRRHRWGRG